MIYDKKYLTDVLEKHGYPTLNVTPEWLQFAILLVIADNTEKHIGGLRDIAGNKPE
jgi:hypothetical protein